MRVVLDTNVIISALNFPGNERMVLELALRGRFQFYLSVFILEEVAGVLARKFGWDGDRTARAIGTLETAATVIEPPPLEEVIEGGHADNRVLECAVAASADYLVTGDPAAPVAPGRTLGCQHRQCAPVPVGAGPGPVGGG